MAIKKLYQRHQEKINYLAVGAWNTLFGYVFFALLYFLFGKTLHYLVLLVLANIVSITNSYLGYKFFVFKTKGNYLREYLRVYMVYGVAMLINLALLPLVVEGLKINPVPAQGFLVFVNVIFSYFGHKKISFRRD